MNSIWEHFYIFQFCAWMKLEEKWQTRRNTFSNRTHHHGQTVGQFRAEKIIDNLLHLGNVRPRTKKNPGLQLKNISFKFKLSKNENVK